MTATSIRAAVCREFAAPLQIETLYLAPPAAHEVQVKLFASSICHSDIIFLDGGWGGQLPAVFGHEGAGVVVAAGADSGIAVGSRVIVTLMRSCGRCLPCQRQAPALCEAEFDANGRLTDAAGQSVAVGLYTAAFAEQVVVAASQVAVVEQALPYDQACLLACGVLTGFGAVTTTAEVPAGASVAVVGCGGVGINCLQAAVLAGATALTAVDLSDNKLALARQFGAEHGLNAGEPDIARRVNEITAGRGFDYVFMAAGSIRAVEQAAQWVGKMGTLVLVGMPPAGELARLDVLDMASRQQRVLGCKMGGARLEKAIPALLRLYREGRLNLQGLIAARYPLDDINLALTAARVGESLRQVIIFPEQ